MGKVIEIKELSDGHFLVCVAVAGGDKLPVPGQFYMLRCSERLDPLLPRPFSIHGCKIDRKVDRIILDFLVKVVGTGTSLLVNRREGESIDILGPLGNGFYLPDGLDFALFVAGGIGIAPLPYLAERLFSVGSLKGGRLLLGAASACHVFALERFNGFGCDQIIYTEDGSMGKRGCTTDGLTESLAECQSKRAMVFACGPSGMLLRVASECNARDIPCQLLIDRRMACGVGACMGCIVRAAGVTSADPEKIYKRVCKDGPVFYANEISLD